MDLTAGSMLQCYHSLVPGITSILRDSMGPFKLAYFSDIEGNKHIYRT